MSAAALLLALATTSPAPAPAPEAEAIHCHSCIEWNQPQAPFRIFGNTWYVGTRELSAILVTGPQGHVLLDGALPQSAPLIRANIEALGFKLADVKWIGNSHAHFDHAGGIAALQEASGARVAASPSGAAVLRAGTIGPDDPQYDPAAPVYSPKVREVHEVRDGEALVAGPVRVVAMSTPGHTPGGTSWTWRSCEGETCRQIVYADSLTPVSVGDFRYTGGDAHPDISARFAASIERIRTASCDIVVATHPGFTDTMARHEAGKGFVDPAGCRRLAEGAAKRLEARLAEETQAQALSRGAR